MSLLLDLLLSLVEGGESPSDRGLMGTFMAASAGLLSWTLWIFFTTPDPFRQHPWALAAMAASMFAGGLTMFLAWLHWTRNEGDGVLSAMTGVIGCAAVAAPILVVWTR